MPVFTIEAPQGASPAAKQKLLREITDAIHDAWPIPDTRGFLREYSAENVSQDGEVGAESVRPVIFLEAPELTNLDIRRKLAQRIHEAFTTTYGGVANVEESLTLMNHYPLENAAWVGRLQSDNPEIVGAMEQLNSR